MAAKRELKKRMEGKAGNEVEGKAGDEVEGKAGDEVEGKAGDEVEGKAGGMRWRVRLGMRWRVRLGMRPEGRAGDEAGGGIDPSLTLATHCLELLVTPRLELFQLLKNLPVNMVCLTHVRHTGTPLIVAHRGSLLNNCKLGCSAS